MIMLYIIDRNFAVFFEVNLSCSRPFEERAYDVDAQNNNYRNPALSDVCFCHKTGLIGPIPTKKATILTIMLKTLISIIHLMRGCAVRLISLPAC